MNFRQQSINSHARSRGYSQSIVPNSNDNRRAANNARVSEQPKEPVRRNFANTYTYSSSKTARSQKSSASRLSEQPKASKKNYLADIPSSSRSSYSQHNPTPQSGETSHSRHLSEGSSAPQTNRRLTGNMFNYIFGPPPPRRDIFITLPEPENCLEQFAREIFDMPPPQPEIVIVDHLSPQYYPFPFYQLLPPYP